MKIKNIIQKIRDFFEIIVPCTTFMILFGTFILQVFMRYVLRNPLSWSNEVIVSTFTWTVLFGACYSMRERSHVKFTMVTDALPEKLSSIFKIAGNIIIVITFIMMIPASIDLVSQVAKQYTPVFKWSLKPVFVPLVYFFISIAEYSVEEIIEDFKVLKGGK
ncbi:MAG: TRAP transporter small permease [Anaerorhabdus sp.]